MNRVLHILKPLVKHLAGSKASCEIRYWQKQYRAEGNSFQNSFYSKLMLSISDESDDSFLSNKVVADFGCGPRGSLLWAKSAQLRIGIDLLSTRYLQLFPQELLKHNMVYVTSTEFHIPLPDEFCDVVYSVNSLDHVQNLIPICNELRRILKPGGQLIGSFNLNHPPRKEEPQKLSENTLKKVLFRDYTIKHWWVSAPGSAKDRYQPLYNRLPIPSSSGEKYLWAKAYKPQL